MVAANISITQGSGTRLGTSSYTEGGVTVHDEKTILGETYLPTAIVNTSNSGPVLTTTVNSHLLQIMAGASLRVRIRRIELYQVGLATTAAFGQIFVVRLTTAGTGGSNLGAPVILDTSDGAVGATAMTLPTAKGTEGTIIHAGAAYYIQTAGASSTVVAPFYVIDFDRSRSKPLIIAAGAANGIAIKTGSAIAAATVNMSVWLDETSW